MIVDLPVRCISKDLCSNCPHMELELVTRYYDSKGKKNADDIRELRQIECKNYMLCTMMLRYLNLNYDPEPHMQAKDAETDKYVGREGD